MTKKELADVVYNVHGGLSRKESADLIDNIIETLKITLQDGEKVQLSRFGVFEIQDKAARKGVNPVTKETINIPEHKAIAFRPSNFLKKALNE